MRAALKPIHSPTGARLARACAVGFLVALLGVTLSLIPRTLELEEHAGLDWLFSLRGPIPAPDEVIVVSIGRDSADAMGLPPMLNEWPRSLHGELLEALSSAGAAVVALDMIFDQERVFEEDRALAQALQAAGNVILLERVRQELHGGAAEGADYRLVLERRVPPIERFKRAALGTAPFPLPTVPVKVSQFWVFGRGPGDYPTLPAVAVQAYALNAYEPFVALLAEVRPLAAAALPRDLEGVRALGGIERAVRDMRRLFNADEGLAEDMASALANLEPAPEQGERDLILALIGMYGGADSRYLHYYGPPRTVRTIPYHVALRHAPDLDLAGKMVFVGFSETNQPEQQDTFYSVFSERTGANLSGVEIAATAFANLLEQSAVRPLEIPSHLALVTLWGLFLGAAFALLPVWGSLILAGAAGTLYVTSAAQLFQTGGLWLPLVVPILVQLPAALFAVLLWNHRRLRQQRERIQTALGYYVPARVIRQLAHESMDLGAGRQLLHGTCLVTDADRYTTLSEAIDPDTLGQLMNEYYSVLVEAVHASGGEVADIGGDSVVAIWAAARPTAETRERACRAALQIQSALAAFNRDRGALSLPTRIGLDSGEVLLGNVGARRRFEYRAVGDIVNTASRLEGLNRQLGTRILVSGRTLSAVGAALSRPLGRFLLVGKREPLAVHELWGVACQATPDQRRLLELFARALDFFDGGLWREAREEFSRVQSAFPDDGPSRFYASQCDELMTNPAPDGWNGALRIKDK